MATDEPPGNPHLHAGGSTPPLEPVPVPGSSRRQILLAIAIGAAIAVVAGFGLLTSNGGSSPTGAAVTPGGPPSSATSPSGEPSPGESVPTAGPSLPAFAGAIAYLDATGGVSVVAGPGAPRQFPNQPGLSFGFPAWSPEGRRIAVVGAGPTDTTVSVLDLSGTAAGSPSTVIYRSADKLPFYLYWEPDGSKVSFLASDGPSLTLREAPADGSAPLDGSGPGSVIRKGAPLYFDWVDSTHVLLHVGSGGTSFVGEVGVTGGPGSTKLGPAGDFRTAVVSPDGSSVAFVRAGTGTRDAVVLQSRTGRKKQTAAVYGPAALVFDPTGTTVATIGATDPALANFGIPAGPLRLLDPGSAEPRVLLDGLVAAFFWSPDGRTIAALRLEPKGSPTAMGRTDLAFTRNPIGRLTAASASAAPSPLPGPIEVHLLFVDVASGSIRSNRVVQLADRFVNELLPYFDQYALSHRLWAPDSSAFLLPTADRGATRVLAVSPDGGDPLFWLDSEIAFWSP